MPAPPGARTRRRAMSRRRSWAMPTPSVPEDPHERERVVAAFTASYPSIMRMATYAPHAAAGCDEDAEFGFALDLILAGVYQLHQGGWR